MDIQYSKRAIKAINGMDKPTKQRIRKAIEGLPKGDIKTLQGAENSYRLRVGDWRILFSYLETEAGKGILIEKVAPRGEVYKGV
jgi:mRNA interferase RelE/StbE